MAVLILVGAACGGGGGAGSITTQVPPGETGVEEIRFSTDGFDLVGDLVLPGGSGPYPAVIVVSGDGPQTRYSTPGYADLLEVFGGAGFAVAAWDKPGSGESAGELDGEHELTERARIVAAGIDTIGDDDRIDGDRIGLWGLSQGGWVMPLVLDHTDEVAFLVSVSGGGENSIEQLAFQLGWNHRCRGGTEAEADLIETYFPQYATGTTYAAYVEAMQVLGGIPGFESQMDTKILDEEAWQPWPSEIDAYLDPTDRLVGAEFPVLAVFGERDRYVDPLRGVAAYQQALAGNPEAHVELIPGAGHLMESRVDPCSSTGGETSERYLELIAQWADQFARAGRDASP